MAFQVPYKIVPTLDAVMFELRNLDHVQMAMSRPYTGYRKLEPKALLALARHAFSSTAVNAVLDVTHGFVDFSVPPHISVRWGKCYAPDKTIPDCELSWLSSIPASGCTAVCTELEHLSFRAYSEPTDRAHLYVRHQLVRYTDRNVHFAFWTSSRRSENSDQPWQMVYYEMQHGRPKPTVLDGWLRRSIEELSAWGVSQDMVEVLG